MIPKSTFGRNPWCFLLLFSFIFVSGYLLLSRDSNEDGEEIVVLSPTIPSNKKGDYQIYDDVKRNYFNKGVDGSVPRGDANKMLSPREVSHLKEDQAEWLRSRGYFDESDYSLYASYSDSAIRDLASEGDLLALSIWSNKLKGLGAKKEALETKRIAAIYGSTEALVSVATWNQVESWRNGLSDRERRSYIKGMMVYAEVAARRGDRNGIVNALLELQRRNTKFSKPEVDNIGKVADKLYASLEAQRKSIGLKAFNNEENPFMEIQMDFMTSAIQGPHGWGNEYIGEASDVIFSGQQVSYGQGSYK